MTLQALLKKIEQFPERVTFQEVMTIIDAHYHYRPTGFSNGAGEHQQVNPAGSNEGSCKLLAFGQLHGLSETQMLHCFGDYYRDDVLKHPEGTNHGNIRAFMKTGWSGVSLDGPVLTQR